MTWIPSKSLWVVSSCRPASSGSVLRGAAILLLLALVAGCASSPAIRPGRSATSMVASWYGPKYHGRQTASGEVFDMNGLTAAHKTLPFGTKLRVTYPSTSRTVVVVVNDRGPFIRGRELDLSYGAAKELGMVEQGVARVKIERLK
ncbi:MAG: septal ring lytic transglycosylase RlpA family protein [Acidobacteria bacterium]|nr:septal ring lytic transglycosylase RlpA family protein [Acidobacteriota bacterium]